MIYDLHSSFASSFLCFYYFIHSSFISIRRSSRGDDRPVSRFLHFDARRIFLFNRYDIQDGSLPFVAWCSFVATVQQTRRFSLRTLSSYFTFPFFRRLIRSLEITRTFTEYRACLTPLYLNYIFSSYGSDPWVVYRNVCSPQRLFLSLALFSCPFYSRTMSSLDNSALLDL